MYYCYMDSPIGKLLLAGDETALELISFPTGSMRREPEDEWQYSEDPFGDVISQINEYFEGKRHSFDLPLRPNGTEFQLAVLDELLRIPYGETTSYGEVATRLGRPKASRAVGAANGRNPIPIIIPCHRVVGSKCELTGFGGGIETKKTLLELERGFRQ